MAVTLDSVQSTVCDIVKAAGPLANVDGAADHVFSDDGTKREAIEDSLKGAGWAIVVSPPIGVSVKDQVAATSSSASGAAQVVVLTNVAIRFNPKKNIDLNIFIVVAGVIKAALGWKPAPSEKGFSLPQERPFEPDFMDEGCFTYDVRLLKAISL